MKNKKNNSFSGNGIVVCDSIVMSVRKKKPNIRRAESVIIALVGYISTIMVFLNMFPFRFSRSALFLAATAFAAAYIALALVGKKAMWFISVTVVAAMILEYKFLDQISLGFKFAYNVIFSTSYKTEISYYKFLDSRLEFQSVTIFFVFSVWLLALVIFLFTIHHPNTILPFLVTFPLLETGLYNGIKVSIFWGMMLVAYWIALLAVTSTDFGEYSGGTGGFVRKENVFSPKRQMRLKVTEKCGIYIIAAIMLVSGAATTVLKLTDYKRSDEINQKRSDIRNAINSFSVNDLSESISNFTTAFGLTLRVQTHKLGNVDRLRYKDRTDLVVDMDAAYPGAIYLKEYTGSVYKDNQWTQLPDNAYNDDIFEDFKKFSVYPQTFPGRFNSMINNWHSTRSSIGITYWNENGNLILESSISSIHYPAEYSINIEPKLRGTHIYFPYGVSDDGSLEFDRDCGLLKKSGNELSYKFSRIDMDNDFTFSGQTASYFFRLDDLESGEEKEQFMEYCRKEGLLTSGNILNIQTDLNFYPASNVDTFATLCLENDYKDFVYENYLQVPDSSGMREVRNMFSDILDSADSADTAKEKLALLESLRDRIASEAQYSLNPGRTPDNRDFVNFFLLENKKGYCTHFATTGVVLARMAGIPARYATGYVIVGDDFNEDNLNDDGTFTINVKNERSHAWTEVYINGYGWIPFEFTAGYSENSIDTSPTTSAETSAVTTVTTAVTSNDDDNSSTTRSRSSRTTSNSTAASTNANTTPTGTATGSSGEFPGGSGGGKLASAVKHIFTGIAVIAIAASVIMLRRRIIIWNRKVRFRKGSPSKRMGSIYAYSERLLSLVDTERGSMSYSDFASYVDEKHGGELFHKDAFAILTDVSLRATFSGTAPTNEEIAECIRSAHTLARNIYDKSGMFRKLCLKYVYVLVN